MCYAFAMVEIQIPQRVLDRIEARVKKAPNGCWLWPGAKVEGYGRITWSDLNGKKTWHLTHRVMHESVNGPIPEGMQIDHICHDPDECSPAIAKDCPHRACCNPEHLRAVSTRENLLRGGTVSAARRAVEECPKGHAFDASNTLVSTQGQRSCKACTYERNRAYYHKNSERRKEYNRKWRAARKSQS
jgi:hypothetical protein